MKRVAGLIVLVAVLTAAPAAADFYVVGGGGRLGTAITTLPYTITSPGLYYLANNLTLSNPDFNAIKVDASDVTIDLMGFCLTGPGKGSGTNFGIKVAATRTNVEIRNGSIKAFGVDGILSDPDCTSIRVVGIRVRDIGRNGIALPGSDHLVMDCVVNMGVTGIFVGSSSLVKGSQVAGNTVTGIYIAAGSKAVGNTVRGNYWGIDAKAGSLVADNTVSGSSVDGILAEGNCTITRNNAYNNTGRGITAGTYCTITNNTTDGLFTGANCALADNAVAP